MAAFKKGTEELQAAKESLRELGHEQYSQKVEAFLQCEQQWVLLHRVGLMTRGHNTNNLFRGINSDSKGHCAQQKEDI
ncbi:hypothetical protein MRX96_004692 [Rhipicephalus microplus]